MELPTKQTMLFISLSAALFSTTTLAQSDPWHADAVSFTPWEVAKKECGSWSPSRELIDWGVPLRQSHTCLLTDRRERIFKEKHQYTGETRVRSKKQETRIRQVDEWRTTYGSNDRIISTVYSEKWSDWQVDRETLSNCQWRQEDVSAQVDLNTPWLRVRHCDAQAERRKPIYQYWLSGKTTRLSSEEPREYTQKTVTEPRYLAGKNNRWLPEREEYTPWRIVADESCAGVSADLRRSIEQLSWGTSVLLPVTCEVPMERRVRTKAYRLDGDSKLIAQKTESKVKEKTAWRVLMGQEDAVIDESWVLAEDWYPLGDSIDCGDNDLSESIPWGERYLNYQTCDAKEARDYHLVASYRSGKTAVLDRDRETRPTTVTTVRWSLGKEDELLADQVKQRTTEWVNDGSLSCSQWSPTPITIDVGVMFYQTRECQQTRQRYVESLSRWRSGDKWVRTERQIDTENTFFTQTAEGIKTISYALEPITLEMDGSASAAVMSPIFTVDKTNRYDRLRVEVTLDKPAEGAVSLSINSDSGTIQLPDVQQEKHMFFFSLDDYNIPDNYSFHLRAQGQSNQAVTVRVYWESL